jgi:hypothetical protein
MVKGYFLNMIMMISANSTGWLDFMEGGDKLKRWSEKIPYGTRNLKRGPEGDRRTKKGPRRNS